MLKWSILLTLLMGCAFAVQPNSDPLTEGIALLKKGDVAHSLILLRQAVKQKPGSAEAHNYYGFALGQSGAVAQAVVEFQKALDIDPQYPDALYNLGAAFAIEEQYTDAIEKLKAALALKPDFPEPQFELGNPLAAHGTIDEAVEALEKAVRLRPSMYAGMQLALLNSRMGELKVPWMIFAAWWLCGPLLQKRTTI